MNWKYSEWSKEYSFITPPTPGSKAAESVRFIAYGDMGYFDSGKKVAELIEEEELDDAAFIMHVGYFFIAQISYFYLFCDFNLYL